MPYSSGVYTAPSNSFNPAVSNTTVDPTDWAALLADLSTALSTAICKDGQTTVTANLPMNSYKLTGLLAGTASGDSISYGQVGGLQNYLSGLTLSAAGSTATFGIAAGIAAESTNVALMTLASAYTKTTSSWALGTAAGALDTGAIANSTWYHVWLIQRSDTLVVDVLVSTSASSPTMPTNYDRKRRIGSMKTDGSAQWVKFSQDGDDFLWDSPVSDANNLTPANTSAFFATLSVPSGIKARALFDLKLNYVTNASTVNISSPDTADVAPSATVYTQSVSSVITLAYSSLNIRADTSSRVRLRFTDATPTYYLTTRGWVDPRGRT